MENRKPAYKPDGYEAVYYDNNWEYVMRHDAPYCSILLKNVDQGKHEDVYAQDGWRWYKHDEELIVTLQPQKYEDTMT